MTTFELKLATAIAQDPSVDLSQENFDALWGFGLSNFQPVTVSIRTVAKCMRWQCQCLDGSWDYRQHNEDLPCYRRKVHLSDLNLPELRSWLVSFVQDRLQAA